jgi:hypothetical protein
MTEKRQPIEDAHLESSIAVALKLAHFRPSRLTTESDLICAQAARAVMESFQRSGWVVVSDRPYSGWGASETMPHFGGRRGCEDCD